ncbi:hypothetical protein LUX39_29455 [Actinomadura madurae]|nr:hypothetical protein [Actinomadura madurae]MCQ0017396.1 hypothetical protein [Actinomadura madurae]
MFTRMSNRPNASTQASIISRASVQSETSPWSLTAREPFAVISSATPSAGPA